jgi:small conductance mechanosensitive channel
LEEGFNLKESLRGITTKLFDWLNSLILYLPDFLLAVVVFALFIFLAKYVGKLTNNLLKRSVNQASLRHITVKVIKAIVILIGFFVALGILDLNKVLTSVLAGVGVLGLAIGFALQGTLINTFSGIILSFYQNFKLGIG